jgi:DNA-binding transcriptional LysR family regulator
MDRLELMGAFVRVAETGSITQAARELGTTQPTVSKWLSALEARTGARLVLRNTQGLTLTDAGVAFFRASKRILGEVEEATAEARGLKQAVRGTLRLNALTGLGEEHLTPIALEFQARHPGLVVELTCSDDVADLVEERVDVAVRLGTVGDDGLVAKALGGARYVLVASPAYLKRAGALRTPEQLSKHPYLFYGGGWHERLETPSGPVTVPVHNEFRVNSSRALRVAALAGHGIARLKRWLVHEELVAGRLVEVLPGVAPAPEPTWAVYLPAPQQPAKVKAFVAFLKERVLQIPGWVPPERLTSTPAKDYALWPPPSPVPPRRARQGAGR